jgi:hypothetical protein
MKYNYMFRSYMWATFRLRFYLQSSYTICVGAFFEGVGDWVEGKEISLFQ